MVRNVNAWKRVLQNGLEEEKQKNNFNTKENVKQNGLIHQSINPKVLIATNLKQYK